MDKLEKERQIIQDLLIKYSQSQIQDERIETQLILDTERNHYSATRSVRSHSSEVIRQK